MKTIKNEEKENNMYYKRQGKNAHNGMEQPLERGGDNKKDQKSNQKITS